MVNTEMKMKLLVGWLAVGLLVASACSDPDDSQVATLTETKPPAPVEATQDAPPDPPPPPAAEPPAAPEVTPAEAPAAPEPESPPEPEPPPLPQGELDAAAVAALISTIDAAQSGVTSSREQLYLTLQLSFGGQSAGSVSDVPFMLSTTVGDLTHIQMDPAALAALSGFEDGMPQPAPAGASAPRVGAGRELAAVVRQAGTAGGA